MCCVSNRCAIIPGEPQEAWDDDLLLRVPPGAAAAAEAEH